MRYRRRLLLLQQPPRLAIPQAAGLLHDFQRLGEGDEEGHGGGSEVEKAGGESVFAPSICQSGFHFG